MDNPESGLDLFSDIRTGYRKGMGLFSPQGDLETPNPEGKFLHGTSPVGKPVMVATHQQGVLISDMWGIDIVLVLSPASCLCLHLLLPFPSDQQLLPSSMMAMTPGKDTGKVYQGSSVKFVAFC